MAEPARPAFPDLAAAPLGQEAARSRQICAMLDRGSHMQLRNIVWPEAVFVSSDFTEQEAVRVSQTEVIG